MIYEALFYPKVEKCKYRPTYTRYIDISIPWSDLEGLSDVRWTS